MKKAIVVSVLLSISIVPKICPTEDIAQEYYQLAQSYSELGNNEKSIECFKKALQEDPNHFEVVTTFASALVRDNKLDDAIDMYKQAISLRPDCAQAYYNLALCLEHQHKLDEALDAYTTALALKPDYGKALLQKGIVLHQQGRNDAALPELLKALQLDPLEFDTHWYLARIYKDKERHQEAIEHLRRAIEIRPRETKALVELANTLNMYEDTAEECLSLYYRALDIEPRLIGALYNAGYTLKKLGRIPEAIVIYDRILSVQPEYALARFGRALSYLMLGDFERGWQEYEWRWRSYNETPKKFNQPVWDGSDIRGKRILVYAEQGLGDTFQFIRYVKLLKEERGAHTIFVTQKPLKQLLSRCDYIDQVIATGDPCPAFDVHVPLMSLPMLFKTRVDTVPTPVPYLSADPDLVDYWRERLAHDHNFKIGLCWQGNAHYRTSFLRQVVAAKSTNVNTFAPLADVPGVSFYSLQKTGGEDQLGLLSDGFMVHTFGPDFDESHGRFMDTAAIMKNLDLIISVDTGTCHLAAALGVEVWVPLPFPADWRWMLQRKNTPWYPTMRLFRQEKPGDWTTVVEQIREELEKHMMTKKAEQSVSLTMSLAELAEKVLFKSCMQKSYKQDDLALLHAYQREHNPTYADLTDRLSEIIQRLYTASITLKERGLSCDQPAYGEAIRALNYLYLVKERIKQQLDELPVAA